MKHPTDIETANEQWGANCGPCALAGILDKEISEVRQFLTTFDKKRYMNPTDMKAALTSAGVRFTAGPKAWPEHGLVFIQWGGFESRPVVVQYQHTHWIAVEKGKPNPHNAEGYHICDVNAPYLVTKANWESVMPAAVQEDTKGCNGTYSIRCTILLESGKEAARDS